MKTLFIIALMALSFSSWAADTNAPLEKASGAVITNNKMYGKTPDESLLKPMLNKYVVNEMIDIRPIEGHHFNLKANNNCSLSKPQTLKPEFMQCQFKESGSYKINAYICDDKESFCKFEKLDVLVSAPRGYKEALKKRVSSNILYIPKSELKAPPHFIKNRDQFAISQAREKNQPLLIVFAAQWCPACNMLDENVFHSKEFQDQTKNVVKLILDVDSDISWDLKEKFKVGGYPTTVLTTSTLNEIGRFVGYRTLKGTNTWIANQLTQKDNPIDLVASKIKNGASLEKDVLRLGEWHLDRDEAEAAKQVLGTLDTPAAKRLKLIADSKIFEKDNKEKEMIQALHQLIDQYPKDVWLSSWAVTLSEKDPEGLKKKVEAVKTNVETWASGSEIDMTEFTPAELYYNLGATYENLQDGVSARQSYANCAAEYKKIADKSTLGTPRGAPMERGFCLAKASMNEEALKVFESLVKVYKTEFAFNYYYARTLLDTGNIAKAYQYAKSALDGSYGDNMIRAAVLKAQIEIEQKNLNLAETTVTKALEKVYLPATTQIRSHRYVANLKGVLAKIQIQKEALKTQKETK